MESLYMDAGTQASNVYKGHKEHSGTCNIKDKAWHSMGKSPDDKKKISSNKKVKESLLIQRTTNNMSAVADWIEPDVNHCGPGM